MDLLLTIGGIACVAYTAAELAAAAARRPAWRFSAVDLDSGRELEVMVDRRARADRRRADGIPRPPRRCGSGSRARPRGDGSFPVRASSWNATVRS